MLLPGAAHSQPSESATKQARRHLEAGQALSALGQQDAALAEFTRAYDLAKLPGFLFNIAVVQRRLENLDKAQEYLKKYIELAEEGPTKKGAEQQLKEIEEILSATGDERDALLAKEQERSKNEQKEEIAQLVDSKKGLLVVSSVPPGCRLVINGGRIPDDITPYTAYLSPGRYVLELNADGYEPFIEEVTLSAKKAYAVVAPMKKKPSTLTVRVSPEAGRVEVDGELLGEGQKVGPIVLGDGEHNVVVKSPGFQPWKRQIALAPGQQLDISADLEPSQGGLLKVASYGSFGIAGVGLVTGSVFGLIARGKAKDFEAEILDDPEFDNDAADLFNDGVAAEQKQIIFMIIGGSAALLGGGLYGAYRFSESKAESKTSAPSAQKWQVSPGVGGASVSIRW